MSSWIQYGDKIINLDYYESVSIVSSTITLKRASETLSKTFSTIEKAREMFNLIKAHVGNPYALEDIT